MAERTVTLTIRVNDQQVKSGEASLKRLKVAAEDVGRQQQTNLSQPERLQNFLKHGLNWQDKIGPMNEVEKAIEAVTEATSGAADASDVAAGGFGQMSAAAMKVAGVAAVVVTAIVAVVAVVVKLGKEILDLSRKFADYAMDVGKASEETGLMAETVSALKLQAERTGRSFDVLKGPINEFRKTIGQAAAGSEDARKKLNLLGIDSRTAINQVDQSFRTAIANIVKAPTEMERVRLAFAAFGTEGYKLLPFFRSFNGDVDAAIRKAEELGVLISGRDVQAANAFNRAYTDVQKTIQGITHTFGREFLPVVGAALKDFSGWLTRNRGEIKSWAEWAVQWIERVINAWKTFKAMSESGMSPEMRDKFPESRGFRGGFNVPQPPPPPRVTDVPAAIDYSRPQDAKPDPAALEAARLEMEKKIQATIEFNKRNWDAAIDYTQGKAAQLVDNLGKAFETVKGQFETSGDIDQFQRGVDSIVDQYIKQISQFDEILQQLESRKAQMNKATPNELAALELRQQTRTQEFADKYVDIQKKAEELVKKAREKSSNDYLKNLETEMNRAIELKEAETQTKIAEANRDFELSIRSERDKVDEINRLELESMRFRKTELQKFLGEVTGNAEKEKDIKHQILLLDQQIAQQQVTNANRVTDAEKRKQETLNKLREQYEDLAQSLEDQLLTVSRGNRPLTVYEETLRAIERDYKDLAPAQKQHLLDLAAQIDVVEELNRQHAELKDFFSETLSYAFEGDFEGMFDSLRRRFLDTFTDRLSEVLATNILGFDPNATDNPVAKPIVGKLETTNKLLGQLVGLAGGNPSAAGVSLSGILSGFGLPGMGPGGTPFFNSGGGGGINIGHEIVHALGGSGGGASGGGGFLKNIFGPGGIFGEEGFGNNTGTYGAIGAGANLIGGLVGGRVGGIISSAGSGLAIGAQIGSFFGPVGTAVGAAIGAIGGFFAGLFGGDPKRKRDKNEKIPALNKGFTDALKELNNILTGVRTLSIDPDEAIVRANEVRGQIAGGFGIDFESKKYRKQAQTQIRSKLTQADSIIAQIKAAAEIARGAADRSKRILPEFAGGHYFADFFRPNGLIPGMFDGRDNILAMISRGEMILNPVQQARVRALAGGDVFAHAGIPNYPKASASPQLAVGGIAGAGLSIAAATPVINFQPNLMLEVHGIPLDQKIDAYLTSDTGIRTQIKVKKMMKQRGEA